MRRNLSEAAAGRGMMPRPMRKTTASSAARGWKTLATPGIMCGILGYAIGTFAIAIGVAVAKLLMQS